MPCYMAVSYTHLDVYKRQGEGLLARAFAHEIDHLDGVLFTDKMVERIIDDDHDGEQDEHEAEL